MESNALRLRCAAAAIVMAFMLTGCSSDPGEDRPKSTGKSGTQAKSKDRRSDGKSPSQEAGGDDSKANRHTPDVKAFSLTAKQFYDEFQADKDAFQNRYRDAIIEIDGKANDASINLSGPFVRLDVGKGDVTGPYCFTMDKQPWAMIACSSDSTS